MTTKPFSTSAAAVAAPMPEDAPVTRATGGVLMTFTLIEL
jgi:hypothetical protein